MKFGTRKLEIYRIVKNLALFAFPFLAWQAAEIFLLPLDAFTFRAWEALGVAELQLPGPFYPDQDLNKFSAGDQEGKTPVKWVRFITDKYGFRNRTITPEPQRYDIVVIGDSNIVGSHIDQENIISEVLAKKCNCSVYNYAYGLPRNILAFLNDPRFKERPPKYVVFEMRPGDIKSKVLEDIPKCQISKLSWDNYACRKSTWLDSAYSKLPLSWQINIDRLHKQALFHFVKSRLGIAGRPSFTSPPPTDSKEDLIKYSLEKIKSYSDESKHRGTQFIFLYFPYFQRDMDEFAKRLENAGVETIALLPDAKHTWSQDDYYKWTHKEDSHWLESSIVETADLIMEKLQNFEKSASQHEYSSLRSSSQSRPRQ